MNSQSPFLDVKSFIAEEAGVPQDATTMPAITPFLPVYESVNGDDLVDPETEEYVTFLNELYDEEFDDALAGLINEAATVYESEFLVEQEASRSPGYAAERLLEQHFAPLAYESELMFETLASSLGSRNLQALTEEEIDTIVDRYQPEGALSPTFEDFFGKLKKAVKKVASKATSVVKKGISLAAKVGLQPVLNKLKGLIKPLLKRVINTAIRRLPRQLRPLARKLARRHPLLREVEEAASVEPQTTATSEMAEIQYEFNEHVANLLFATSEVEQDLEITEAAGRQQATNFYTIAELDRAREQFIEQMVSLQEGEDPAPHVEEFVPALLPALRLGIRLAGRPRVVSFLSQFLSKMIVRFVGKRYAPALSKAIVDAGLRLMSLEVTAEEENQAAGSAVAATVEETVRRVAQLPDYVLDDQELLEGFALEAFEQAAGANLPPLLSEKTYRKRPGLGKGRKFRGVWIMKPHRRGRRYKKFSRNIPVKITPRKVAPVDTFEGLTLEEFLVEQYAIEPGEEFEGLVHLYETIPGTRLSDIARLDEAAPGISSVDGSMPLHPLNREAAALLLGEPEMAADFEAEHALNPHTATIGQRLYYLEIPGKRPLTVPDRAGRPRRRRPSSLRLILDFPRNEMRLSLFMSEIRAQELAVKLRQRNHTGAIAVKMRRLLKRGLHAALKGSYGRLKILHGALTPDQWPTALRRLSPSDSKLLKAQITEWMVRGLATHLKQNPETFVRAAENSADGVTITITIKNPPAFHQLRDALVGKASSLAAMKTGSPPPVTIKVSPGYNRE